MLQYPVQNLFNSSAWQERIRELGLHHQYYEIERKAGIFSIAYRANHHLSDFESWPEQDVLNTPAFGQETKGAQLAFFRKLTPEAKPFQLPAQYFTWVSTVSPYVNLQGTLNFQKRAMDDIKRCERNLCSAIATPQLTLASVNQRQRWFEQWFFFQEQRRLQKGQPSVLSALKVKELFHRWTTEGSYPPWLKLFQLDAGETVLCRGLCLVYDGVFYFQLPSFNPDPDLRKFGLGKLFVQKLIDWSLNENIRVFDFLQGDEEYKFSWNPTVRKLYQCEVPLSAMGRALLELRKWRLRDYLRNSSQSF